MTLGPTRVPYRDSNLTMSTLVFSSTVLKQAEQNLLCAENGLRGLGTSMHFSPFTITAPQPAQWHFFPATAAEGRPADPLMSEGMLFRGILLLL